MSGGGARVADPILPVVIGTAGHIDHGKSSLVKALTGIDPDRLKEEKERGLTIDLGFANFLLESGERVGIVDVPGHERFVRNMVAGATGIDLALLVVAADDGVMPQTREHVDILDLLGVHRAILVVTKVDMVEPGMPELVEEEMKEVLDRTRIRIADVVPVSNVTGQGIPELRKIIARHVHEIVARPAGGAFRMPIQRVFSRPGFGTVVSGIPLAGTVAIGDPLEVVPGGSVGKVRGLHAYGRAIGAARAGHSTAINLTDVELTDAHRGCVVAPPGLLKADTRVAARLKLLASSPPLDHMTPVRIHIGTKEALGRVSLLDAKTLSPGEEGLVQVLLREPVVAVLGDRFLLRLETPPRTIGGGNVLALDTRREHRFREEVIDRLAAIEQSGGDARALLLERAGAAGLKGLSPEEAQAALQRPLAEVRQLIARLLDEGSLVRFARGERVLSAKALDDAARAMDKAFQAHFSAHPLAFKLAKSALREKAGIAPELLDTVLAARKQRRELEEFPDGTWSPTWKDRALSEKDAADLARLTAALVKAGHAPLTRAEVAATTGLTPARIERLLERALDEGSAIEVAREFLYGREPFEAVRAEIVANCKRNGNELMIPELRDKLQTTRKYLIPLLEHFDALGVTRRRGNVRVLA